MPDFDFMRRALLSAISSLQSDVSDSVASGLWLRPSTVGQCPTRLWSEGKLRQAGEFSRPRNPRYDWAAMQGHLFEEFARAMLRQAGAEILDPPAQTKGLVNAFTGLPIDVDGAIRWPEAQIHEWMFLETKFLRAMAAINLLLGGLESERSYLFQVVSYVMNSEQAVENAGWDIPPPQGAIFVSAPKDGATTRMLLSQRLRPAQYEQKPVSSLKPEQVERMQQRMLWRDRLGDQQIDGMPTADGGLGIDFYMEELRRDSDVARRVWQEISQLPALVHGTTPPDPIHDPTLPEDLLDSECAFYCHLGPAACMDLLGDRAGNLARMKLEDQLQQSIDALKGRPD